MIYYLVSILVLYCSYSFFTIDVRLLAGILNASKSFVAKILEDYCGHAINIKTNGLECSSAQAIAVQAAVESK